MNGMKKEDFFIGYQKTPNRDRRFLLTAAPLLILGIAGFAGFFALSQKKPAASRWGKNSLSLNGRLIKYPYPHLLVANNYAPQGYDTVFLVRQGKSGAQSLVRNTEERYVRIQGKLLTRFDSPSNYLLEATAIEPLKKDIFIKGSEERDFGLRRLSGCIIDSKCHYGVMRPVEGITHKSCASLCVRGGIPPFFVPNCAGANKIFLVTDSEGRAQPELFLSYILDAISVQGSLVAVNNYFQFRIQPETIKLLSSSQHPHG